MLCLVAFKLLLQTYFSLELNGTEVPKRRGRRYLTDFYVGDNPTGG